MTLNRYWLIGELLLLAGIIVLIVVLSTATAGERGAGY
jgi:hypothetical protein